MTGIRQLTFEGRRSGEGYYNADGSLMVFQSEREKGNPFYQIYLMDLETGDVERVSPGHGKTTCAWIHPDNDRVLFANVDCVHAAQQGHTGTAGQPCAQKLFEPRLRDVHQRPGREFAGPVILAFVGQAAETGAGQHVDEMHLSALRRAGAGLKVKAGDGAGVR